MNELLAKISSYNIFNYLVPGALLSISAKRLGIVDLTDPDLVTNLLTFYILGMIVSRLGSIFLEPALKALRVVRYAPYTDFVTAAQKDPKVDVLVEVSNTYRTLSVAFFCLSLGYALDGLEVVAKTPRPWLILLGLLALGGIFVLSYRKQAEYVRRRVEVLQTS